MKVNQLFQKLNYEKKALRWATKGGAMTKEEIERLIADENKKAERIRCIQYAEEIITVITAIVRDQVESAYRNDATPDVLPHKTLAEDLGLDSLDMTEILIRAEERFGISLPDNDMRHETTVADLCAMVAAALRDGAER